MAATTSSARREGLDGRDGDDSCCPGEDGGRGTWIPVGSLFFFFSLSSWNGYLYLSGATVSLLVRLTPPFFSGGGLVESGLDCSVFFVVVVVFGYVTDCVGVDRSWIINIFCCLFRPMFSVMCGLSCLLFIVHCSSLCVIFIFYNRHSYFYLLYLIFKRIFHLHVIYRMGVLLLSSFTEYNFGFMNT